MEDNDNLFWLNENTNCQPKVLQFDLEGSNFVTPKLDP